MLPNDIVVISVYELDAPLIYLNNNIVLDDEIIELVINCIDDSTDNYLSLRTIFPTKTIIFCADGDIRILKGVKYNGV